jgi:hypothetical protein
MSFDDFRQCFGAPRAGTSVSVAALALENWDELSDFAATVGLGVFADGLISVGSVRELDVCLHGWSAWLPPVARLFGSSALGLLFLSTSDHALWVVDTQEGIVVESDLTIGEFLDNLTSPSLLHGSLRAGLFRDWLDRNGELPAASVLSVVPALPLGGRWSVEALRPVSLRVHVAFSASLFTPQGDTPVELRRAE